MGTALERSESETDLALKAASYEMPAWAVDGMDVLAVEEAARRAAGAVSGRGPAVLPRAAHLPLPRALDVRPRSLPDKAEIERWKEHDPIPALSGRLQDAGLVNEVDIEQLEQEIAAEIEDAVAFAEAGTLEPVEELERFVYCEGAAP